MDDVVVRDADADDVRAICRFGAAVVPAHYAPLLGEQAAAGQVTSWWNEAHIAGAVADRRVVVAAAGPDLVGVGQRGSNGADHVIYKLYVHPDHRSHGVGPRLLDALIAQLPDDAERLFIEHFAANERAGAFYEREGFAVDRVETSAEGSPALDVVWRVRSVE